LKKVIVYNKTEAEFSKAEAKEKKKKVSKDILIVLTKDHNTFEIGNDKFSKLEKLLQRKRF
jgi:hypothetical protein